MAKKAKVPLNVLVVEGTRQAIKDLSVTLECSQGEVIDRAVLAFDGGAINAGREPEAVTFRTTREAMEYAQRNNIPSVIPVTEPSAIAGVSVGIAPKVEGQFRCRCVHMGCRGAYFQGTSRFQNMCEECRESGHRGDPRNCGECLDEQGAI